MIAVIINPISGTGRRPDEARRRAELAASLVERRGLEAEVFVTEHGGHARELAHTAVARGASMCIAWGGDGTINEVASSLAFSNVALAVVPSGSGNGLARELAIPLNPAAAFEVALGGRDQLIDAGEIEGRMFFNVAGLGFDAHVAHEFAETGHARRGFARYISIAVRELIRFVPDQYTISANGTRLETRALFIAIANSRQYGNGATIAPGARIDDGALDVVVVGERSPWSAIAQMPMLFSGKVDRLPGVTIIPTADVEITAKHDMVYHVDGEPALAGRSVRARVHPGVLRVRVPAQ
ncbi:MAG TPA: diacylglycerol kinase family protein [Vicinamibacterales bacterium]|jgi:diacylglycerol kinase (ATP)|nr:diacylglycerol kinase family protein [Vicinamibacterales bacterium]